MPLARRQSPSTWAADAADDAADDVAAQLPLLHELPLSGVVEDLEAIWAKLDKYKDVLLQVAEDPALEAFIARIRILRSLAAKEAATRAPVPTTAQLPRPIGVGLDRLLAPIDTYIYVRRNPVAAWLGGGVIVLGLVALGFGLGRWTQ